jgi:hypothetical protein
MDLSPPVLFLIFNRPLTTQRVFDAIRHAKPSRLFVAADGPRDDRPGEREICEKTRRIIEAVNWDCQVSTLFREKNLGCRVAVSSAIDWFFESAEEGIILEDDCLPSQSFFPFCQNLLERFRDDARIMQICGSNFFQMDSAESYFFSKYGPVWGWASWRRAWEHYDINMKLWPRFKVAGGLDDVCLTPREAEMRGELYDRLYRGEIDTWDYQWGFAKMINSGLSITPAVNLISNIGFGADATHTAGGDSDFANLPIGELVFPLEHPPNVCRSLGAERKFLSEFVFAGQRPVPAGFLSTLWRRVLGKA